jgi:hypothetical protein
MNENEIKDLINDLDAIGQIPRYEIEVSIAAKENELMLTNIKEFHSHWNKIWGEIGIESEIRTSTFTGFVSVCSKDTFSHTLFLTGESEKIQRAFESVLTWKWVNPERTKIRSKKIK